MNLRNKALEILNKYVKEQYHRIHAFMVAYAMEAVAKHFGEDPDKYFVTGLLHDIDYGPDFKLEDHTKISPKILREVGFSEDIIHAIQAHNSKLSGVEPKTRLDYALIACDEISGLFYAYSLMRPEGFEGMSVKSFKKKFKDKAFAKKVDRADILKGIDGLGIPFDEHITLLIKTFEKYQDKILEK